MSSRPNTAPTSARVRVVTGRSNFSTSFGERPATAGGGDGFFSPVSVSRQRDTVGAEVLERMTAKELKTMLDQPTTKHDTPETQYAPKTESKREGFGDYKAMETRMFSMGFQEGFTKGRLEGPPDPYSMLDTSRSARLRIKKEKDQKKKALTIQRKNEDLLAKFVKRNADEMWEYVPTLYHTQRDEHHHLTPDDWLLQKTKDYCHSSYGGNMTRMLHTFQDREVAERLRGSHNMRRTICPTVRHDVPVSLQKSSPELYGEGYNTHRQKYDTSMHRIFQQSPKEFFLSTNGGNAGTEHRFTKTQGAPICEPGNQGRTNLSGWADVNSTAGNLQRPVFLRGSAFAQPHESF